MKSVFVIAEHMETKQIHDALTRLFDEEGQRLVFWNDPGREFVETLPALQLDNVQLLRLDEVGALEAKIRLERDDPTGRYLLYAPAEEPDYENDWLLDVRLYSRSFRADRASIILDELGLANQHLRQHLADRRKFFDNKERLKKLQSLVAADDTADDLDRKMLAVVVRADQPELFTILRTLFHAYTEGEEDLDLNTPPPAWEHVEKYDLAEPFWHLVQTNFGYSEASPSLRNLLLRLLLTDYAQHLDGDVPTSFQHLLLPKAGRPNAVVCLAQWRDSSSKRSSYDQLSAEVASILKLDDHLPGLEIDQLRDVMTFLAVERAIASGLRDRVLSTAETINAEEVRAIATRRQAGHWASLNVTPDSAVPRQALHAVYAALIAAADFFTLRNQHRQGFDFDNTQALYRAYETQLYRFDQVYRHFCEAADQAESQGWGILKALRDEVEACYANWYVTTLGLSWGEYIEPHGSTSLLTTWQLDGIRNQQRFFDLYVRPRLEEAENRKVYVIISDAFRYEAAQELVHDLNGKYRVQADLSSQLGVLPSYTPLGMASLLPHQALSYKPSGEVLVDGKSVSSLAQRNDMLQARKGMACRADDLLAMKKDAGREFVEGKRVVYIYHNAVDAVGASASTEGNTFEGVRKAINELAALVTYVINTLNGNHILVTADHGFLFTETAPGETDKSKLAEKPQGTVRAKKRYLLGQQLPEHAGVWHGKTATTAQAAGEMEFWIPKGANRFHFTGGARFIHGGAMLQEIVVPVITVKHVRGKSAKETRTKQVPVQVLGTSHKITTPKHRFELIQMEPVSERIKPVTLKVAVYEGEEPVTDVQTVTFDSPSATMDERKQWVPLVLQDRQYNKKTPYRLVLRDAATGLEHQSVDVTIDRAFSDDF